jgi:hypothetical protein
MQNTINNNHPTALDVRLAALNARLATINALAALVGTLEINVPPIPVNTAPRAVPLTQVPPMPVNTERGRSRFQRGNRGRLRSPSPDPIRIPGWTGRSRSMSPPRRYPVSNLNDIDEKDEETTTT